jgi:hypothetical protein
MDWIKEVSEEIYWSETKRVVNNGGMAFFVTAMGWSGVLYLFLRNMKISQSME